MSAQIPGGLPLTIEEWNVIADAAIDRIGVTWPDLSPELEQAQRQKMRFEVGCAIRGALRELTK